MKNAAFILIVFFIFSCTNDENNAKKETLAIVTLLYNKESSKEFPPPPPNKSTSTDDINPLPKISRPEYNSDKIIFEGKYAIIFKKDTVLDKNTISSLPSVFKEIVSKSENKQTFDSLKELVLNDSNGKEIPIIYENIPKLNDIKNKFNVIGALYFFDVYFNKGFNKAIIGFGAYTHGLSGYTIIYGLEKIDGEWRIILNELLSES